MAALYWMLYGMLYRIESGYEGQRWNNAMCGLHFITETQTYGPYASECEIQYTVNIPEDATLLEFLSKQLKYIGEKKWVLGFIMDPTFRK